MASEPTNQNPVRRKVPSEQALRLSELRYRRLFEAAQDGILILEVETGRITDVNPFLVKLLGFSHEEMVGQTVGELSPFRDLVSNQAMLERLQKDGYVRYENLPLQTQDGRQIAVEFVSNIYQAGDKRVIQCNIRDITARRRVERALQQSEAEFRSLAETMPQIVWATRADGGSIYFNQQWSEYTGLTPQESLDDGWNKSVHPEDQQQTSETWQNAIQTAGNFSIECRLRRADGVYRWWWVLGAPFKAADGTILKWFGSCTDITDRKQAENTILESKRFLRSALDSLSSHIAILDEHGTIIEVNRAWNQPANRNGFNGGDSGVGTNYLHVCDTATGDFSVEARQVAAAIRAILAGLREEFYLEYRCDSPSEQRWFTVQVTRFSGEGPVRVVVAHENITERKQAELELLWKTMLLEAQLDSSIDGILVVDAEGNQLLQNLRMIELWKIPASIVSSRDEAAQVVFATRQTKNPKQFVERVKHLYAHPNEVGHDEIELIDGTTLDRYSSPVRDKAGKHYGRIWSFRDITERRKLEYRIRQMQRMEAIGQLAGGIAHDFNNILSAIVGTLYLTKLDAANPGAVIAHVDDLSRATTRATELVKQILTFSMQSKAEREPIQLRPVVLEALKLLRASVPASIRIQIELAETPAVLANAGAIHQLIMNLGTNSWHAMHDQQGELRVEMKPVDVDDEFAKTCPDLHPGQYVRLSVIDTGSGMDSATMERIFDPFFTTKPVGQGTGLGLAVVHGIMKSHDGGITVYSQPGEGTAFHLYFPVVKEDATVPLVESTPIPKGHGEHILFVDDEAVLASLGKRVLEQLGYVVTAKTNPLDALAAVAAQPDKFALVITDLTMPVMDGAKLGCELLRIRPDLLIILTTGYSRVMTLQRVEEMGFRDLLQKPNSMRTLGEAVHRALHPNP